MNGGDVVMAQLRGALGFLVEVPAVVRIALEPRRQALERHDSLEARVIRAVDLAHAADAQERPDGIAADSAARKVL